MIALLELFVGLVDMLFFSGVITKSSATASWPSTGTFRMAGFGVLLAPGIDFPAERASAPIDAASLPAWVSNVFADSMSFMAIVGSPLKMARRASPMFNRAEWRACENCCVSLSFSPPTAVACEGGGGFAPGAVSANAG